MDSKKLIFLYEICIFALCKVPFQSFLLSGACDFSDPNESIIIATEVTVVAE